MARHVSRQAARVNRLTPWQKGGQIRQTGPLCGVERTLGLGMSAFTGEADGDQRPPERPLLAISGPKDGC